MEELSGRSLDRFFEQWVYRAGHPELEIKIEHECETCKVTVKQTQHVTPGGAQGGTSDTATPLFSFDLAFDLAFTDGEAPRREVRRIDQASHAFVFRAPSRPRYVVVDPEL